MAKKNGKGRSKGGGFVMLRHDMLGSKAWAGLSSKARAVLIQIAMRYKGGNNGYLAASTRDLATECNITPNTVTVALRELIGAGFIVRTQEGSFSYKMRHAAEYQLTWRHCDRTGFHMTNAWKGNDRFLPKPKEKP